MYESFWGGNRGCVGRSGVVANWVNTFTSYYEAMIIAL